MIEFNEFNLGYNRMLINVLTTDSRAKGRPGFKKKKKRLFLEEKSHANFLPINIPAMPYFKVLM